MSTPKEGTTHTPGPWRWCGYYLMQDCRDEDGARIDNPFSTPAGRPIACDGSASGEYNATIDTGSMDAHLIAAAPDLLDALKRFAEPCMANDGNPCGRCIYCQASQAISKATGEGR